MKDNIINKNRFFSENLFESAKFEFRNFNSPDRGIDFYRQHPEDFLKRFAPHKLGALKNALSKIKFNFKGKFIADLTMPMNIGGYFSPSHNILAINPMLLLSKPEKDIAHVLLHEGWHAGVYGPKIMEEVVVETLTKKRMAELYGGSPFRSGYDGMVSEASEFFGNLSFNEMQERVENNDQGTFDNFLELMVVNPSLKSESVNDLQWGAVKEKLKKKWGMITRLFPRMVNSIAGNNRGLHESAKMNVHAYKLEGVLERTAQRLLSEQPEKLVEVFDEITERGRKELNEDEIMKALFKKGFAYLIDFDSIQVKKMIKTYVNQNKALQMANFYTPINLDFELEVLAA